MISISREIKRMVGEAVEKKLYDATSKKHQLKLEDLVEEDDDQHQLQLVHGVPFAGSRNLVHVATMWGQAGVVEEVLKLNPQLARMLDSQKLSPLHIAAQRGNVAIAKLLLRIAPETCWWREDQGMNPVHIAAVNGHVEVLRELIKLDMFPAMERVHRGQTVLHLCVKHRQRRTLEVLVEKLGELVCAKDDDGETLLHLAVRSNQLQVMQYLVESKKIEKLTANSMGKTALKILEDSPITDTSTYLHYTELLINLSRKAARDSLPKQNDVTMVAVVLMATMAFQVAVSPPGGVWQDDSPSHRAGEAVMASTHPKIYEHLVRANTTTFVSSVVAIFILVGGGASRNFIFVSISLCAMVVSLVCIALTYAASVIVTTPNTGKKSLVPMIITVISVFWGMIVLFNVVLDIQQRYSSWERNIRLNQDLTTASPVSRLFFWIFSLFHRILEWIESHSVAARRRRRLYLNQDLTTASPVSRLFYRIFEWIESHSATVRRRWRLDSSSSPDNL